MQAMETIVAQTRRTVRHNFESGTEVVTERIWNPVIADITLLALGTSSPQISLAIIDALQQLGEKTTSGSILQTEASTIRKLLGHVAFSDSDCTD